MWGYVREYCYSETIPTLFKNAKTNDIIYLNNKALFKSTHNSLQYNSDHLETSWNRTDLYKSLYIPKY